MVSRLLGLGRVNVCVLSALFCSGVFDLVFLHFDLRVVFCLFGWGGVVWCVWYLLVVAVLVSCVGLTDFVIL